MELGMTPTPEIHVADKPFIVQQFLFSNFGGNPRGQCAEQIKNGAAIRATSEDGFYAYSYRLK